MSRALYSPSLLILVALLVSACESGAIEAEGSMGLGELGGGVTDVVAAFDLPKATLPEVVEPGCSNDDQCALPEGKLETCLRSYCELKTGLCAIGDAVQGKPCDDLEVCSLDDYCEEGVCRAGPMDSCEDDNACTYDICEILVGCRNEPLKGACDDANPCTIKDACQDGICTGGEPADCSDGDPCTQDVCDPAEGCGHAVFEGPCDDADLCTENDLCTGGACTGSPVTCTDPHLCTDDVCDPLVGCAFIPQESKCDDGDSCTVDVCDLDQGCVSTPFDNGTPCDDQSACTEDDACLGGACLGAQVLCTSEDPCFDPICDFTVGCTTFPNVNPCNDLDPCTTADKCQNGVCTGTVDPWCGQGGCGDGLCDGALGESCSSCPTDCGPCGGGGVCGSDPWYTCQGSCGGNSGMGCYCDDACENLGDCCPDKAGCCGGDGGGCGTNPWDTCQGACGGISAFGCWCDDYCENAGDCCSDKGLCCGGAAADDSCIWAWDGFCDEPVFCTPGTDCSDCGTCW